MALPTRRRGPRAAAAARLAACLAAAAVAPAAAAARGRRGSKLGLVRELITAATDKGVANETVGDFAFVGAAGAWRGDPAPVAKDGQVAFADCVAAARAQDDVLAFSWSRVSCILFTSRPVWVPSDEHLAFEKLLHEDASSLRVSLVLSCSLAALKNNLQTLQNEWTALVREMWQQDDGAYAGAYLYTGPEPVKYDDAPFSATPISCPGEPICSVFHPGVSGELAVGEGTLHIPGGGSPTDARNALEATLATHPGNLGRLVKTWSVTPLIRAPGYLLKFTDQFCRAPHLNLGKTRALGLCTLLVHDEPGCSHMYYYSPKDQNCACVKRGKYCMSHPRRLGTNIYALHKDIRPNAPASQPVSCLNETCSDGWAARSKVEDSSPCAGSGACVRSRCCQPSEDPPGSCSGYQCPTGWMLPHAADSTTYRPPQGCKCVATQIPSSQPSSDRENWWLGRCMPAGTPDSNRQFCFVDPTDTDCLSASAGHHTDAIPRLHGRSVVECQAPGAAECAVSVCEPEDCCTPRFAPDEPAPGAPLDLLTATKRLASVGAVHVADPVGKLVVLPTTAVQPYLTRGECHDVAQASNESAVQAAMWVAAAEQSPDVPPGSAAAVGSCMLFANRPVWLPATPSTRALTRVEGWEAPRQMSLLRIAVLGDNGTASSAAEWLAPTLMAALGLPSGIEVSTPWIETGMTCSPEESMDKAADSGGSAGSEAYTYDYSYESQKQSQSEADAFRAAALHCSSGDAGQYELHAAELEFPVGADPRRVEATAEQLLLRRAVNDSGPMRQARGWTVSTVPAEPAVTLVAAHVHCGGAYNTARLPLAHAASVAECARRALDNVRCGNQFYASALDSECGCVAKGATCTRVERMDSAVYQLDTEPLQLGMSPAAELTCEQLCAARGVGKKFGAPRSAACGSLHTFVLGISCSLEKCCLKPGEVEATLPPTPRPPDPWHPRTTPAPAGTPLPSPSRASGQTPAPGPAAPAAAKRKGKALGVVMAISVVLVLALLGVAYLAMRSRRQASLYQHVNTVSPGMQPKERRRDSAEGLQGGVIGEAACDVRPTKRRGAPQMRSGAEMRDFMRPGGAAAGFTPKGEPAEAPPVILLESCSTWPALCGVYRKQHSVVRDMPWWRRDGGGGWLANDRTNDVWMFSLEEPHFDAGVGWVKSGEGHGGMWPHSTSSWEAYNFKTSSWQPDPSVCVVARYDTASQAVGGSPVHTAYGQVV